MRNSFDKVFQALVKIVVHLNFEVEINYFSDTALFEIH